MERHSQILGAAGHDDAGGSHPFHSPRMSNCHDELSGHKRHRVSQGDRRQAAGIDGQGRQVPFSVDGQDARAEIASVGSDDAGRGAADYVGIGDDETISMPDRPGRPATLPVPDFHQASPDPFNQDGHLVIQLLQYRHQTAPHQTRVFHR